MEKPADVTYPIHALLQRRWSPRAFADRMVEPDKLQSLFEAARWAPSDPQTRADSTAAVTEHEWGGPHQQVFPRASPSTAGRIMRHCSS
jgi:hypothetical protein